MKAPSTAVAASYPTALQAHTLAHQPKQLPKRRCVPTNKRRRVHFAHLAQIAPAPVGTRCSDTWYTATDYRGFFLDTRRSVHCLRHPQTKTVTTTSNDTETQRGLPLGGSSARRRWRQQAYRKLVLSSLEDADNTTSWRRVLSTVDDARRARFRAVVEHALEL